MAGKKKFSLKKRQPNFEQNVYLVILLRKKGKCVL